MAGRGREPSPAHPARTETGGASCTHPPSERRPYAPPPAARPRPAHALRHGGHRPARHLHQPVRRREDRQHAARGRAQRHGHTGDEDHRRPALDDGDDRRLRHAPVQPLDRRRRRDLRLPLEGRRLRREADAAEPVHPREQPLDGLRLRVQRRQRRRRRPDQRRHRRRREAAVHDERHRRRHRPERRPVDGLDAAQIVAAARTKASLDADTVDGVDAADLRPASRR